jgi:serine/threonine protein kinase
MKNPFYLMVGAVRDRPTTINVNEQIAEYLERHPSLVSFDIAAIFPRETLELTRLPDILPARLTALILNGCQRLTHLPKSLPAGLVTLGLSKCQRLTHLPENLPAGLTSLVISDSDDLTQLPESLPSGLSTLDLSWCSNLTHLPRHLPVGLTSLRVTGCSSLSHLPEKLPDGLTALNLSLCSNLTELPKSLPAGLCTIELRNLSNLTHLPESLPYSLTNLNLFGCSSLSGLPERLPAGLVKLRASGCSRLNHLPETLPTKLNTLYIGSKLTHLPAKLPPGLTTLYLCTGTTPLPQYLSNQLPAGLSTLSLCSELTRLPDNLPSKLTSLSLRECSNLASLPEKLPLELTTLDLSWCSNLAYLPESLPSGLNSLNLSHCRTLTHLPEGLPPGLSTLDLSGCIHLTQLPNNLPAGLIVLNFSDCINLSHLPENLPPGLTTLNVSFCESLSHLPENLPAGLTTLKLTGSNLTRLPVNFPAGLTTLDLNECLRLNVSDRSRHISSRPTVPNFSVGVDLEELQRYKIQNAVEALDKQPWAQDRLRTSYTTTPSSDPASQPADDLVGTVYAGKYELNSILGTGGMGVIYRGRQVFLDWPVAVKMLKSDSMSAKARTRFHQEAKAVSALKHPGIVSILDFGVDDLDRPYMVMEYVEGCNLSDLLLERLVLPMEDLLPLSLEICDALSAAHKKGIVHRDLKPSNIMLVANDDGQVQIKLLDFGVAKMLDVPEYTRQDLTKTGDALGTPLYMSPEQIESKNVTYRSDLYSLGCTLYACLTGTPPFIGETKIETMDMHCADKPMSLKEASEGLEFSPGIEAIIMRLLEKRPGDRYESAEQVKDALIEMAVTNGLLQQPNRQQTMGGLPYLDGANSKTSKNISDIAYREQTAQVQSVTEPTKNPILTNRVKPEARPERREPGAHLKNTIYWVSDLPDRVKAARAAKLREGQFKSLPVRGAHHNEQEHTSLSTKVEASMNKKFVTIGAVLVVTLILTVVVAALYFGWTLHKH